MDEVDRTVIKEKDLEDNMKEENYNKKQEKLDSSPTSSVDALNNINQEQQLIGKASRFTWETYSFNMYL